MNDWMTSVADIPDDADDDLDGISPELVLVDPELARLVREREPGPEERARDARRVASALRLLPSSDDAPVVPRAVSGDVEAEPLTSGPGGGEGPERDRRAAHPPPAAPPAAAPSPAIERSPVVREAVSPSRPARAGTEAVAGFAGDTALPLAAQATDVAPAPPAPKPRIVDAQASPPITREERVLDAEPARALAPPRPQIPAPLAEPPRRDTAGSRDRVVGAGAPAAAVAAMPHPVTRPAGGPAAPVRRAPSRRRRGRRVVALLVAVAAASVAVLGVLRLTGESSNTGGGAGSAVGTPPTAKKAAKPSPKASAAVPTKQQTKATSKVSARQKRKAATPAPAQKAGTATPATPKPATNAPAKTPAKTPPKASKPAAAAPATPKAKTQKPSSQSPKAKSGASAPKPATQTRRFAWAPVAGATGYHVELFRGADRVLAVDTKEPVLELGSTWRYNGKTVRLTPGEYRWYVWPVTKSGRATQAVVQAKLTV